MTRRVRIAVKTAVWLACLTPLATLVYRFQTDGLGANPIDFITDTLGDWTLRFLLASLALTPIRLVFGVSWPVTLRRLVGLFAFAYAVMHFSVWIVLDHFFDWPQLLADVVKRPYITVGVSALLTLVPLAATSTSWAIKRLGGRNWKRLHRLVYVVAVLGVLHYFWLAKVGVQGPYWYALTLALLLGIRLWDYGRRRLARGKSAPATARGVTVATVSSQIALASDPRRAGLPPSSTMISGMQIIRTACAHDCPDQCSLLAHVEEGRVVRIQGDPAHPFTAGFTCTKVNRDHELLHSPERILRPLRRIGPKGEGRFAAVTWDEALDEIVSRWQAIMREDGPQAILGYAYSAHQGQFNRGLLLGLFHALGATRLQAGTVCDTCAEAGWDAACGSVGGTDPETVVNSDLVISWGADLMTTNVHFWPFVEEARRRGARVVVIEPRRSRTAERADWHVRINVGTDTALALGVMHVLARDGRCDRDWLARRAVGFERLEREVLPRFTPPKVAEITGVPASDVERLASMYGQARAPFIRLGEGMSRCAHGGQAVRAVALLPGVVGAYDRPGGGALLMTAAGFGIDSSALRKPPGEPQSGPGLGSPALEASTPIAPAQTRLVNHSRLGKALLELRDPPIRALFVAANNPAVTCPDAATVRRGLAREDLFTVVHDPFLSDTARYADIVLPAATYLESEDVLRAYGTYYVQFAHQVVAPRGEAWPNRRLAQELARRLGLDAPVFSMDTDELLRALFSRTTGTAATLDVGTLRTAGPVKLSPQGPQRFATPSGKLEFYSESLASQGLPAMPDWVPDPVEEEEARRWPLRLLTAPGYYQAHTAYAAVDSLRRRQGPASCVLHPEEAARRGMRDGDAAELFNDRGAVTFVLRVSDEAPPGVAFVPGQRPTGAAIAGTINVLCSDRYSDFGEGATYQSTWLDVRKVGGSGEQANQ